MTTPIIVPEYMVGRNGSLMGVTTMDADNTGTLTVGTAYSLKDLGTFKSWDYEAEQTGPDVHPADATITSYQVGIDDFTITISDLQLPDGSSSLALVYYSVAFVRIAIQSTWPAYGTGSGSPGFLFAAIGRRTSLKQGLVEGENAVVMTIKPCGIAPYWGAASGVPF